MLPLDKELFNFFYGLTGQSRALDWLFIFFAKYLFWLIVFWFIWVIFTKKDWGDAWPVWKNRFQYLSLAFISFLISRGIVTNVIDNLLQSPRPFAALGVEALINHANVNSFPSGHMASLIPIALTLFIVRRSSGIWVLIATLAVGLARVITGVHWPSDILGGIAVGILSFSAVYLVFRNRKLI